MVLRTEPLEWARGKMSLAPIYSKKPAKMPRNLQTCRSFR